MTKTPPFSTLQWLAEILTFRDNTDVLIPLLKNQEINWDDMVRVSSQHLMLPSLYCQLKAKGLLSYIPKDLVLYLGKITAINRNRNAVLTQEAQEISELFNEAHIEHVFIKGMALIAANTFEDMGARMIGDIDIVVADNQLHDAFELLKKNGYTENIAFNYTPKNYRHLLRQINPDKMGAIELHQEVLIHKHRTLIDKRSLLKNKYTQNGINVPSRDDAIRIAVLTTQINDKEHYFGHIKLRSIFDCLALKLPQNKRLLENLSQHKRSQSFLQLSSLYLPELTPTLTNTYSKRLQSYHRFKKQHPKMGRRLHKTLYLLDFTANRLQLLIGNPSYRMHILKNKFLHRKKNY